MKFSNRSIRLTSYVVIAYIIAAISWWAVLLHREHDALYDAYKIMRSNNTITTDEKLADILTMTDEEFESQKNRENAMILSESIAIGLGLLIAIFVINRGYKNLVAAERMKKNFLLSISHELKSPIASTRLAFETLRRFNRNDQQSEQVIEQGLSETNRLNGLVQNVLLATRLDSGYIPKSSFFSVENVLARIIQSMEVQYPESQISINNHVESKVYLDKLAFEIVCLNLVENALKYSSPNPTVNIQCTLLKDTLVMTVSDNGPGIPLVERDKIFTRFYRIGDEHTRKSKGTGLGLYIVKAMVTLNNGKIEIANDERGGAIFTVTWPIRNE